MSGYFDDSGDWVDTSTDTGETPPAETPPGSTVPPGQGDQGGGGPGQDQPGGAGTNGPPTADDVANLKKQGYSDADIAKILGQVATNHPEWASTVKTLLPPGTTFPTGTTPPGTTPPGGTGPGGIPGAMVPSLINMFQKWNQGKDYSKWADQSAALADPFAGQRGQYQTQLADLYKDPSKIADTPGYKFALSQGLGAVANRDNNRFGIGAGSTSKDMMDYSTGLASQTFDKERNALMQMAGANTGNPGAAAGAFTGMHNAGALADTGAAGALGNVLANTNWSGMDLKGVNDFLNLPKTTTTPPPAGTTPPPATTPDPATIVNNATPTPDPNSPNGNNGVTPGGT